MRLLLIALLPLLVFTAVAEPVPDTPVNREVVHNPDHLDGAFTGGFGEPTCHSCHFDYDLNHEGGSLAVEGLEAPYQPGEQYDVTITLESEQLEIGGFQMTSRFEDGSQAGEFEWDADRLTLTPAVSDDLQYVQHSVEGTTPTGEREVVWTLTWNAPDSDPRPVVFNVAANAGNNDDSAFGDWIYVKELTLTPQED